MEKVLFRNTTDSCDFIVKYSDKKRTAVPELEQQIDYIWKEKLVLAQSLGRRLWNGTVYRLNDWSSNDPRQLILSIGKTSYKETVGTHETTPEQIERQFGVDSLANTLVLTCSLITSDNKIVIGQRSPGIIESGKYGTFGGSLDQKTDTDVIDRDFIMNAIYQELDEELGVAVADLTSQRFLGLAKDQRLYPQLHFQFRVDGDFNDLLVKFSARGDSEHTNLYGFDNTDTGIYNFITSHAPSDFSGALNAHLLFLNPH